MKKLGLVLLAFIVAVWFGACGDSKDSQAKSSDNLGESAQKDFIVDCDKCIMTFALGDETIKQLKQEAGEENFYAMADGARYDMRQTQNYAVANGVAFVYIKDSDMFQAFVIADKKVQIQNYFGYYLYKKGGTIEYFPDISHDEINTYFGITNPKDSQDLRIDSQNQKSADSNIDSIKPAQDFNVLNQNATICDDSYKEKVCGGDALLCSANKCLYKNLTNIDEAFKFYVGQEIKKVAFSKERDERNVLVYKYMLGIALPKENESKKITTSIEDYYSKQYGIQNQCDFEFKRTSDSLMIEFNNCDDSKSNTIIFTQKGEAVEIINKSIVSF